MSRNLNYRMVNFVAVVGFSNKRRRPSGAWPTPTARISSFLQVGPASGVFGSRRSPGHRVHTACTLHKPEASRVSSADTTNLESLLGSPAYSLGPSHALFWNSVCTRTNSAIRCVISAAMAF